MDIKPLLKIRFRPGIVQPVTGVGNSRTGLIGNSFIIVADLVEEGITLSWLWNRNAVLVGKGFQLRLTPATDSKYNNLSAHAVEIKHTCRKSIL